MRSFKAAAVMLFAAAPAFSLPPSTIATLDGGHFSVTEHPGKWLLISYWATWCVPCIAEMPVLSTVAKDRPNVLVIGLTNEAITADALRAFLIKHPVSYTMAIVDRTTTPRGFSGSLLGIQMRPLTYLIRPDGRLAKRFLGEVRIAQIEAIIDAPVR